MSTVERPAFPFDRPVRLRPPREFSELRDKPMTKVATRAGDTAYLATSYADIRFVLADARFSPHLHGGAAAWVGSVDIGNSLFQDPPGHTRLRRLISKEFTARRANRLRPRIQEIADELVAAMSAADQPVDVVSAFAFPLPIVVIGELLGVPAEEQLQFRSWSDTFLAVSEDTIAEAAQAWGELQEYVPRLIAAKRADPGDDLLSALVSTREDDRLSEPELIMLTISLLIGGYATTANAISTGMIYLLENDALGRIAEQSEVIDQAVEEVLRHTLGGGEMRRVANTDVTVGDVLVQEGETVLCPLEAANHDPKQFAEPERFSIDRTDNPHVSFGHGIHFCVGAGLARVELQVAFATLAAAFPQMRLVARPDDIPWAVRLLDEGPQEVLVTW